MNNINKWHTKSSSLKRGVLLVGVAFKINAALSSTCCVDKLSPLKIINELYYID